MGRTSREGRRRRDVDALCIICNCLYSSAPLNFFEPDLRAPRVMWRAWAQRARTCATRASNADARTRAVLALGSNQGDRVGLFREAFVRLRRDLGFELDAHSSLYETAPAYVEDQDKFLNAACVGTFPEEIGGDPLALLDGLKKIEAALGRDFGTRRYGPRPMDLDIIFHGRGGHSCERLVVPHERYDERPFVLAPLADLTGSVKAAAATERRDATTDGLLHAQMIWEGMGEEKSIMESANIVRVMPLKDGLWRWGRQTMVMGILNVTPDSFSDGGSYVDVNVALNHAREMVAAGATIIDVGGQSTRPGATRVSPEEESARVIPVISALAKEWRHRDDTYISVDTFYGSVASAAVDAGVDIINDVSGGSWDPAMLPTVADMKKPLPYVVMHVRGDPSNMQNASNTTYEGHVCDEVGDGLLQTARRCIQHGIEPWRLWIDPGIGFAKTSRANVEILRDLPRVRSRLAPLGGAVMNAPMLVGASRKRFLGELSGKSEAGERDAASVAALVAAVHGGADVIRVHNVVDSASAAAVSDALWRM